MPAGLDLQDYLSDLCARHRLPGAVMGWRREGEGAVAAAGLLCSTREEAVGPDTLFMYGSITKMYTTTLVLDAVAASGLGLDDSVSEHLPEFSLAEEGSGGVRIRDLLTHMSGIPGDFFLDTGRGDGAVRRLVEAMRELPPAPPRGTMWSYTNGAFVVAGRLVEVLTGRSYRECLRALSGRLGADGPFVEPELTLGRPAAVGHYRGAGDEFVHPQLSAYLYSQVPAGSVTFGTASDLLSLGQMFVNGGVAATGERVLPAELVSASYELQAQHPAALFEGHGLGWFLLQADSPVVAAHGGQTAGQSALLLVVPEQRLVVAALNNADDGQGAMLEAAYMLTGELAGIDLPPPGARAEALAPQPPADPASLGGRYRSTGTELDVRVSADGALRVHSRNLVHALHHGPEEVEVLHHVRGPVYGNEQGGLMSEFVMDGQARPRYFMHGLRAHARVEEASP